MFLPQALPDETVYSRLVRYHLYSGEIKTHFLWQIFGKRKIVLHPYLTAHIDNLAILFNEEANNIIEKQTLFPIFSFYLSQYSDAIKKAQLGSNGALVIRACQLSAFKGRVLLVAKSCPVCMKQDIYEYGVTYWHRTHQVPGITACATHGVCLNQLDLSTLNRCDYNLLPQLTQDVVIASKNELLLANFSENLLSMLDDGYAAISLTEIYRRKLLSLGFVTKQGGIRRVKVMTSFEVFLRDFVKESNSVFPISSIDYGFFRGLLDGVSPQHPFKHLLFSSWLFGSPSELFLDPDNEINTVQSQLDLTKTNDLENYCLNLLQDGNSLAEVSRVTGKSRCYLKRIALLNGIHLNLMPTIVTSQVRMKILHFAEFGVHRSSIATRLNVSIAIVEQEISSCPGLVKRRKQRHFESKRRKCRHGIARYLRVNPRALRKDVKKCCSAQFFWLYLYDRNWLEEYLPVAMKAKQNQKVNWQQRDIKLSARVHDILLSLDRKISKSELDKLLGGHEWLTKYEAKLPLTMATYKSFNK